MLSTNDFLIVIYNSLELKSAYRSDLVDLFGTPDGIRKGYLGSITRPLNWDWGEAGFLKLINIIYSLSGKDPKGFESYYHTRIIYKEKIIESLITDQLINDHPQMLYVFKHSGKKIPAPL